MGQDARPRILRIALQIDRDIDFEFAHQLRDLLVALAAHSRWNWSNAATSRARIALSSSGPKEMPIISKRASVVLLEQAGHQEGGGVWRKSADR